MKAELILDARATLGEGPAWDSKTQTLYWVDILEKRIYANTEILAQLDGFIGCLAPRKNGNLLLGTHLGFADLEPASGRLTVLASLDEPTTNRINDGKCDPARQIPSRHHGHERDEPKNGSLYSFNGELTRLLDGVRISNGLAWSVDQKTFYYIDTPTREVKASITILPQVRSQTRAQ